MSSTIKGFLSTHGYPTSWSRADEAILALRERGFPVSPAAQEIIRRYGGMNTQTRQAPLDSVRFRIDPFRHLDDNTRLISDVHKVSDVCPIGFDYEAFGLMCIGPDCTIYFEGGPYFTGDSVDEVVEKLLLGEETGFNVTAEEEAELD